MNRKELNWRRLPHTDGLSRRHRGASPTQSPADFFSISQMVTYYEKQETKNFGTVSFDKTMIVAVEMVVTLRPWK